MTTKILIFTEWFAMACGYRETCEKYTEAVEKLSFRLLELISRSLGLPADYFNSKFEEPTSFLRLNHYPPCPVPELQVKRKERSLFLINLSSMWGIAYREAVFISSLISKHILKVIFRKYHRA